MINNLTGLRFYLAIWVVLFHLSGAIPDIPVLKTLCGKGAWGVDVFFVLSGFIIALNYQKKISSDKGSFKPFIIRRFARIFPVHWFTIGLMAFFIVMPQFNMWMSSPNEDLPYHLLNIHAWGVMDHLSWNTVSWSISAEWFAYLLVFPIAVFLVPRAGKHLLLIAAILAWVGFVICCELFFSNGINVTYYGIIRIIPEFLFGMWLFQNKTLITGKVAVVLIALFVGAIATFVFWHEMILEYSVMILSGIVILLVRQPWALNNAIFSNRVILYLGKISYSIYMIQGIAIWIGMDLFNYATDTWDNTYVLGTLGITLCLAAIMYWLIEAPFRKMIVKRWG